VVGTLLTIRLLPGGAGRKWFDKAHAEGRPERRRRGRCPAHGSVRHRECLQADSPRLAALAAEGRTEISDRAAIFGELEDEAYAQIEVLEDALAGPDVPGESFMDKVGAAAHGAVPCEDLVIRELLLPEPDAPAADADDQGPGLDAGECKHSAVARGCPAW